MAFPDNIKYLIMLYCLLNERLRITLQSLFSIPELLKFVEVLVQDVHLRRAHPRHPLTARKHHSGRLKPSLRAPTWATDTHLFVAQLFSHILETWTWTQLSHPVGDLDAGRLVLDWLLTDGWTKTTLPAVRAAGTSTARQETQLTTLSTLLV